MERKTGYRFIIDSKRGAERQMKASGSISFELFRPEFKLPKVFSPDEVQEAIVLRQEIGTIYQ